MAGVRGQAGRHAGRLAVAVAAAWAHCQRTKHPHPGIPPNRSLSNQGKAHLLRMAERSLAGRRAHGSNAAAAAAMAARVSALPARETLAMA